MMVNDLRRSGRLSTVKQRRIAVGVLVFLAGFVPATLWLLALRPAPAGDFKEFVDLALSLVDHHQFGHPDPSADRFPGYPFFLAGLIMVARSYMWIAFWNVGLSAAIGVLVYYLTLTLTAGDDRTAAVAGFVGALNPTLIFFSPLFASEHLFVPLLLLSLLFIGLPRPRPIARALLCGAVLGLAALTRGEGLFYVPVAVLYWFLVAKGRRQRTVLAACTVLACLVVVAPWLVRNRVVFQSNVGLSTTGGINFYFAHNARAYGWHELEGTPLEGVGDADVSQVGYRTGLDHLRENPMRIVLDVAKGTWRLYSVGDAYSARHALWVPAGNSANGIAFRRQYPWGTRGAVGVYYVALLVLSGAALAFFRPPRQAAWLVPLGIVAMNWMCYAVVFWAKTRYRYTAEAFLCVLAAVAISGASRSSRLRRKTPAKMRGSRRSRARRKR